MIYVHVHVAKFTNLCLFSSGLSRYFSQNTHFVMELATDRVSCCIDHLEGVRAIAVNIHVVVAIRDASVTESALTDSGEIAVAFQSPHARVSG